MDGGAQAPHGRAWAGFGRAVSAIANSEL